MQHPEILKDVGPGGDDASEARYPDTHEIPNPGNANAKETVLPTGGNIESQNLTHTGSSCTKIRYVQPAVRPKGHAGRHRKTRHNVLNVARSLHTNHFAKSRRRTTRRIREFECVKQAIGAK